MVKNFINKHIKHLSAVLISVLVLTVLITLSMLSQARFSQNLKSPNNVNLTVLTDQSSTGPAASFVKRADGKYDLTISNNSSLSNNQNVVNVTGLPKDAKSQEDWGSEYNEKRDKVASIAIDKSLKDIDYFKSTAFMFSGMTNVEEIIADDQHSLSFLKTDQINNMTSMFDGLGSNISSNTFNFDLSDWSTFNDSVHKYTEMFKNAPINKITIGPSWKRGLLDCSLKNDKPWYEEALADSYNASSIPVAQADVHSYTTITPTPKALYRVNVPVENCNATQNTMTFLYNSISYVEEQEKASEYIARVYNQDQIKSHIDISNLEDHYYSPEWIDISSGYDKPVAKINPDTVIFDISYRHCKAFTSMSYWFSGFENVTSYQHLDYITNTSDYYVEEMNFTFYGNKSLESIKIPGNFASEDFGFKQCAYMFANSDKLTNIDMPVSFTNKSWHLDYMFNNCSALKFINFPEDFGFSAYNIKGAFSNCAKLESIILPSWFGYDSQDLSYLFENCSSLKNMVFSSGFGRKTLKYTDMFKNTGSRDSYFTLRLPNGFASTSELKDLSKLFNGCNASEIVLPHNFGAADCNYSDLTIDCNYLKYFDFSAISFTKQDQVSNLLSNSSIEKINISNNWSKDIPLSNVSIDSLNEHDWYKYSDASAYKFDNIPGADSKHGIFIREDSETFSYPLKINLGFTSVKGGLPDGWKAVEGEPNTYVKIDASGFEVKQREGTTSEIVTNIIKNDWIEHLNIPEDYILEGFGTFIYGAPSIIWNKGAYVSPVLTNQAAYIDSAKWQDIKRDKQQYVSTAKTVSFTKTKPSSQFILLGNVSNSSDIDKKVEVHYDASMNNLIFYSDKTMYSMASTCNEMFSGLSELINFNDGEDSFFQTLECNDFSNMFKGCHKLQNVNISKFVIRSNAKTVNMFDDCISLQNINIASADKLQKTLDTLGFDPSESFYQENNEYRASQIPSNDVYGKFSKKTAKAVYTQNEDASTYTFTFYYDLNNHTVDPEKDEKIFNAIDMISNIDKDIWPGWFKYEDYAYMPVFKVCPNKVCFDESFKDYKGLKSLSNWFSKFNGASTQTSLQYIDGLDNIDYSKILESSFMFRGCASLENIDLPKDFLLNTKDCRGLFLDCSRLRNIDIAENNGKNLENIGFMFEGCTSMESCNLPEGFGQNATIGAEVFKDCDNLKFKDKDKTELFNLPDGFGLNIDDINNMFKNCSSLQNDKKNPLRIFSKNSVNGDYLFGGCTNLMALDLSNFVVSDNIEHWNSTFWGSNNLNWLHLNKSWTSVIYKESSELIINCSDLVGDNYYPWSKLKDSKHEGTYVPGSWPVVQDTCVYEKLSTNVKLHLDEGVRVDKAPDTWTLDASGDYVRNEKLGIGASEDTIKNILDEEWADAVFSDKDAHVRVGWQINTSVLDYDTVVKPDMGEATTYLLGENIFSFFNDEHKNSIKQIKFLRSGQANYSGDFKVKDVSNDHNWNIKAFYNMQSGELIVLSPGIIKAQANSLYDIFNGFNNLESIDFKNLDTSDCESFANMFKGCSKLKNIDLSSLNIEKVKDFSHMCDGCELLETFRFGYHPVEVESCLSSAFDNCVNLRNVDFGNYMFAPKDASSYDSLFNKQVTEITINHTWTNEIISKLGLADDKNWYFEDGPAEGQLIGQWSIPTDQEGSRTFIYGHKIATATINLNGGRALWTGWWLNAGPQTYSKKFISDDNIKFGDVLSEWINKIVAPKGMQLDHWEVDSQAINPDTLFTTAKTFIAVWKPIR